MRFPLVFGLHGIRVLSSTIFTEDIFCFLDSSLLILFPSILEKPSCSSIFHWDNFIRWDRIYQGGQVFEDDRVLLDIVVVGRTHCLSIPPARKLKFEVFNLCTSITLTFYFFYSRSAILFFKRSNCDRSVLADQFQG